jgi:micrococcal nuclease
MSKTGYCLVLLLMLAALDVCRAGEPGTVYVTNSGRKYHRKNCSVLRRSKTAVTLADAVRSGYGPCSLCSPPLLRNGAGADAAGAPAQDGLYRVDMARIRRSGAADPDRMVPAEVVDHVDGDTVRARIDNPPAGLGVVETIRLLGVDTPETVHPGRPVEAFGREASDFTRSRLLGKRVYLAFDWDLRDRYGRLLAYVYVLDGALSCFNADIIREGYGHAYTRYPFHFIEEFRSLEAEARNAGRGLWEPDCVKSIETTSSKQ